MSLINHYSTLWGLGILFALATYFLLRGERSAKKQIALALIGVALVATWFAIRPQSGSNEAADTLRAAIGQGQPILLELQSPY